MTSLFYLLNSFELYYDLFLNLFIHPLFNLHLCYPVLFCSVLFCSVLFCSVLFCTVLYCSVLYCSVLFYSVLYCSVLFCSVLYCFVLFYSIPAYSNLWYAQFILHIRGNYGHPGSISVQQIRFLRCKERTYSKVGDIRNFSTEYFVDYNA